MPKRKPPPPLPSQAAQDSRKPFVEVASGPDEDGYDQPGADPFEDDEGEPVLKIPRPRGRKRGKSQER